MRSRAIPATWTCYEKAILLGTVPAVVALGWFWGRCRCLMLAWARLALLAIALYSRTTDGFGADLAQADHGVPAEVLPVQPVAPSCG
jgi:hypothetical protein